MGARLLPRRLDLHRALVGEQIAAVGGRIGGPPAAVAQAHRQAQLPGEVGPQKVGQVGAVRLGRQRVAVLGIVLAQAQVVVQEVAPGVAQGRRQRPKADRLGRRRIEQRLDPGGEQVLGAGVPGPLCSSRSRLRRGAARSCPWPPRLDCRASGRPAPARPGAARSGRRPSVGARHLAGEAPGRTAPASGLQRRRARLARARPPAWRLRCASSLTASRRTLWPGTGRLRRPPDAGLRRLLAGRRTCGRGPAESRRQEPGHHARVACGARAYQSHRGTRAFRPSPSPQASIVPTPCLRALPAYLCGQVRERAGRTGAATCERTHRSERRPAAARHGAPAPAIFHSPFHSGNIERCGRVAGSVVGTAAGGVRRGAGGLSTHSGRRRRVREPRGPGRPARRRVPGGQGDQRAPPPSSWSRSGPPFAVVISDQRMPGMTGIELLAELERRTPQTVRMMLTAYSDLGPLIAAVNDGSVYRFFLKPWNPDEMRSAISDAMWLHSAQAALSQLVDLLGQRKRDLEATLENLQRVQGELLAAERMTTVGRFSAGIAHNVRNSLTVMMNLLELVQQNPVGLARAGLRPARLPDAGRAPPAGQRRQQPGPGAPARHRPGAGRDGAVPRSAALRLPRRPAGQGPLGRHHPRPLDPRAADRSRPHPAGAAGPARAASPTPRPPRPPWSWWCIRSRTGPPASRC